MSKIDARFTISLSLLGCLCAMPAAAEAPFFFSTGDPDGKIATAARPDAGEPFEIESADDFVLTHSTSITSATFTGLVPAGASPVNVIVEIYRVFPNDSDVNRTSGPPTFSTNQVPTRVNSPSDIAFAERDNGTGLSFSTSLMAANFPAANSVKPGGIHPDPNFHTGGNGPVTGDEVEFSVNFTIPFLLPADHYFFVPQVQLDEGDFLWLSAPRPIVPPGTSFPPGFTDLQSWTRDEMLDPDWLRVGADIVGAGAFNAAFSVSGSVVPEPSTWAMMLLGFAGLGFAGYRQAKKARPASA
jgi:PEP-CTERM motif